MKIYEELLECGEDINKIGEFIQSAVNEYESTDNYQLGLIAESYYNKHNVTVENFVKWLYTMSDRKIQDDFSANFHMGTKYFRRKVTQHANYILGKGIQLNDPKLKEKLGKDFDHQMLTLVKYAMVGGRSYGFWNTNHLEVFSAICTSKHAGFCPIESTESGEVEAGIRFWSKTIGKENIHFYTLYEADGYTEWRKGPKDLVPKVKVAKRPYKVKTISNRAEGTIITEVSGYGKLPIISFYASDTYTSDFDGFREDIDVYDLTKNGLANNIADAQEIYWIIKNAGGMSDKDVAKFLARVRKAKGAVVDSEDGGDAEAHTMETPYEARKELIEIIRTDLYDDWSLLDRRSLSASQKTQQELDMAYQPQDDYINDLEFFIYDFLDKLFVLAELPEDTEATMQRNKISNKTEQTTMVLSAASLLSPECIIRHLPFLTPEEAEEEILKLEQDQVDRWDNMQGKQNPDDEDDEDNNDDTD